MKVSQDISAKQVRVLRDAEVVECDSQATTNSYSDVVGSKIDTAGYTSLAYTIKNSDASDDLDWKVLGSIDDDTYVEVQAEETLGQTASDSYSTTQAVYRFYKIQVKSTVADTPAAAVVAAIAK